MYVFYSHTHTNTVTHICTVHKSHIHIKTHELYVNSHNIHVCAHKCTVSVQQGWAIMKI